MKENGQRSREKIRIWMCPASQVAVYLHYYQRLRRDEVGCVEICVSFGLSHPETKVLCDKGGQKAGAKVRWAEV